ncbi:MAG TPA: hypothetical protein PKD20_04895 [Candidatus Saccharibacteria bacterium]|jgi:hypothetical protein|nr:hypothetical protein [Candidatus Saccharibacteria bacterium]HMT56181.1 hypothetical protein [Candidatus Saccharibacteria bacterium]
MSNIFIALLAGLGSGTWVGNKFMRRTGGNTQKALGGGFVVGLLAFLLMLVILSFIPE